jgi:NAD(P)-dependent dehydrogenase (short-subunit alcohol dehydrogenase family)
MADKSVDPPLELAKYGAATGRCAEAHKGENINGPGDSRPTAMLILEDRCHFNNMSDKVVLMGCSSGLGIETFKYFSA